MLRRPLQLLVFAFILAACSPGPSRHAYAAGVVRHAVTTARDVVLESLTDDVATATKGVTDPAERERIAAEVAARYMAPDGPIERADALNLAGLAYVRALLAIEQARRDALTGAVTP